ncbi:MAG TPA: MBL fold metallo-hydrolase [Chthoniobacteraceae bacterium]|nr:MBL fold metallo-hydrolase [Chthoniobacteraceae bacterium]
MNTLPLEDNVDDVLGKAQRGLKLDDQALLSASGLSESQWEGLLAGKGDAALYEKVAPVLELDAAALKGYAKYAPRPVTLPGLLAFNTPFDDMTVNAYLAWDAETKEAVLFDTSTDATVILEALEREGLNLRLVLLTHTHGDHILELDRIVERTGADAYVCEKEPLEGAQPFEAGDSFQCGSLKIASRQTSGHSPGGITYLLKGLSRPVAVVGDALFAGSMGGAPNAWNHARESSCREILTLPEETVICPGHGPLTTVGEERLHNPFFAARFA